MSNQWQMPAPEEAAGLGTTSSAGSASDLGTMGASDVRARLVAMTTVPPDRHRPGRAFLSEREARRPSTGLRRLPQRRARSMCRARRHGRCHRHASSWARRPRACQDRDLRRGGRRTVVVVRRGRPALHVELSGHRLTALLLGADDRCSARSRPQHPDHGREVNDGAVLAAPQPYTTVARCCHSDRGGCRERANGLRAT
jgi:hypothetical protein